MMNKVISNTRKGEIYAFTSGMMYGLIGYFGISIINASNSIENMIFWRFTASALILLGILGVRPPKSLPPLKEIGKIFLYGMIYYYSSTIIYFYSCRHIGSGLAMVIFFTYPVVVVLVNKIFYKDAISKLYYVSLAIIMIGMICIADITNSRLSAIGMIYSALSAVFYGLYIVATRSVTHLDPVLSSFLVSLGCSVAALFLTLLNGTFVVPHNMEVWLDIAGMALISTALPIILLLESMRYISSTKASILSVSEPIFVVIFGMLLLGEQISIIQAVGVAVILAGAILTLRSKK